MRNTTSVRSPIIVEDDILIASELEELAAEFGWQVDGCAQTVFIRGV